jgi:hypothetical protein
VIQIPLLHPGPPMSNVTSELKNAKDNSLQVVKRNRLSLVLFTVPGFQS